jgi:hypothetical protein
MNVGLLAVVLMLGLAAAAILWPLRTGRMMQADEGRNALEIARDSKLSELRELELDFRLGKLSAEDYQVTNAVLRSEAVQIMRALDANGGQPRSRSRRR